MCYLNNLFKTLIKWDLTVLHSLTSQACSEDQIYLKQVAECLAYCRNARNVSNALEKQDLSTPFYRGAVQSQRS